MIAFPDQLRARAGPWEPCDEQAGQDGVIWWRVGSVRVEGS